MSNKKWRRPANPDHQPPGVEPVEDEQQQVQEGPPKPEVVAKTVEPGTTGVARSTPSQPTPQFDLNVSDDEAQGFINEMTRFLAGIVRRTNVVLEKSTFHGFEHAVAAEPVQNKIEQAQNSLPRSHPLLGLIRFALAATRLLNRILQTTKPHLFGRPSNAFKNIMFAARASKEFLNGNVPFDIADDAIGRTGLVN